MLVDKFQNALVYVVKTIVSEPYRHLIKSTTLYGSAARGDYSSTSNIDLLIEMAVDFSSDIAMEIRTKCNARHREFLEINLFFADDRVAPSGVESFNNSIRIEEILLDITG